MSLYDDPFEAALLRRAFIGMAAVLVVLLAATVAVMLSLPSGQPAPGLVLVLRIFQLLVLTGTLVWAWVDKSFPWSVPPVVLALNCLVALTILAGSGGNRLLSYAIFLIEGAQFLLAFGFFVRRQWITLVGGAAVCLLGGVLFLVLPGTVFPQELSEPDLELGLVFLMFFGLTMVTGFVAVNNSVFRRIAEKARKTAEQLRVMSFHDPVTGLPNGLQLEQDMKGWEAENRSFAPKTPYAVILTGFRLDGLDELNERHGVEATTKILADLVRDYSLGLGILARLYPMYTRPRPFLELYRVESNLFASVLTRPPLVPSGTNGPAVLADTLNKVLIKNGLDLHLGFQGGFTSFPDDADSLRQLLRNLLNLLHSRRVEHLGKFVPFNQDLYQEHLRRDTMRQALGLGLETREFRLVFQPKVAVPTGRFSGFEALARWSSLSLGAVPPSDFIPLAEQTGQIGELTDRLLEAAFAFLDRLKESGFPDASVAVNLSPGVFVPEFLDRIIGRLRTNGLGPRLDIEITEGVLMRLSGPLHDRFIGLKALGVTFSIDDFGTGYSNLGYLQNLEADVLKIDKQFIDGIPGDGKNGKLVTAIIQMAHSLGMAVVAEGVESPEQRDFLEKAGCDQIQGYFYSRPLEADAAVEYLKQDAEGAQSSL